MKQLAASLFTMIVFASPAQALETPVVHIDYRCTNGGLHLCGLQEYLAEQAALQQATTEVATEAAVTKETGPTVRVKGTDAARRVTTVRKAPQRRISRARSVRAFSSISAGHARIHAEHSRIHDAHRAAHRSGRPHAALHTQHHRLHRAHARAHR